MNARFRGGNREQRRQAILHMEMENRQFSDVPVRLPDSALPPTRNGVVQVWRSCEFLVQVFEEKDGATRVSVNRCHVDPATMQWLDNITWDEMQVIKRQLGFGDRVAVEVYPADVDIVNVANMRHMWVLLAGVQLSYAWRRVG